ncbi:MAG: CBS domain-containing protein [Bacteroidales bacterium]|nr:CBS domain-containing protein [Bacteroidales bacterium]
MIAKQLINPSVVPLSPADTGSEYLYHMDENKLYFIPVVEQNKYIGLLSEDEIFNLVDPDEPVRGQKITLKNPSVKDYQHVFEVIRVMAELKISVLPVVSEKNIYLGSITPDSLLGWLGDYAAVALPGGIIVLELNQNDYVISQIAQIVESQDAKILSLYVAFEKDSTKMEVTLKVNKTEIQPLIQTFNRYNYIIKATYSEDLQMLDDLRDRYNALMNYLNI